MSKTKTGSNVRSQARPIRIEDAPILYPTVSDDAVVASWPDEMQAAIRGADWYVLTQAANILAKSNDPREASKPLIRAWRNIHKAGHALDDIGVVYDLAEGGMVPSRADLAAIRKADPYRRLVTKKRVRAARKQELTFALILELDALHVTPLRATVRGLLSTFLPDDFPADEYAGFARTRGSTFQYVARMHAKYLPILRVVKVWFPLPYAQSPPMKLSAALLKKLKQM